MNLVLAELSTFWISGGSTFLKFLRPGMFLAIISVMQLYPSLEVSPALHSVFDGSPEFKPKGFSSLAYSFTIRNNSLDLGNLLPGSPLNCFLKDGPQKQRH